VTSLQGHHQHRLLYLVTQQRLCLLSFPAQSQRTMAFVIEETNDHIRTTKGKGVPLQAMKADGGGGVTPVIRILRITWRLSASPLITLPQRKELTMPTG